MSHFVTAVFVPTNIATQPNLLERYLEDTLAPFDENLEVEEYDRDCHCVGSVARNEARARADAEFGTIESLRNSFAALVLTDGRCVGDMQKRNNELMFKRNASEEEKSEYTALDAELDKLWKSHLAARSEAEKRYFDEHPMKDSPDPTCGFYSGERQSWWPEDAKEGDRYSDESGCGGTGTYRSTYNPNAQWDWWVVGGRWNGWLAPPEAQPEKNPDNWETCWLCQGTGMRNDALGKQARDADPTYTCNGCGGEGKSLVWPTQQKDSGYNVVSPRYIESLGLIGDLPTPYAFIDLQGEWHQKGDMGWWGMSSNEKDRDAWVEEWRAALADVSDGMDGFRVVVVDMHI